MRVVTIIFIFILNFSFSQRDTIIVDLDESSITLRKCKGVLFNKYHGRTFTYPKTKSKTDSLFVYNKKTIFFQIYKNGKLIIQGQKLPEIEATDTISFYKNGKIIRQEVWVQQYVINDNGMSYASSDEATWVSKHYFKNDKLQMELIKTIKDEGEKGVCFKTIRKKKSKERIVKCKCYK